MRTVVRVPEPEAPALMEGRRPARSMFLAARAAAIRESAVRMVGLWRSEVSTSCSSAGSSKRFHHWTSAAVSRAPAGVSACYCAGMATCADDAAVDGPAHAAQGRKASANQCGQGFEESGAEMGMAGRLVGEVCAQLTLPNLEGR